MDLGPTTIGTMATEFAGQALGRSHREDEATGRSGGPAGNARLTAWTGIVLLALFLAELVTLLDVGGWLSWHVAIGILLIPPALVKTGSTGWRIVRYYTGDRRYRAAGPPPMALRVLGPLVVASTLAVLGTGVTAILMTPDSARQPLAGAAGLGVSVLMLHKASFVVWGAATGVHTLGRLIPALQLTVLPAARRLRIPGRAMRASVLITAGAIAVAATAVILVTALPWGPPGGFGHLGPRSGNHHRR